MRNSLAAAVAALAVAAAVVSPVALAADGAAVKFRKISLSDKFYSEGACAGDFNHDGKLDYAAGGWWYEGPDFTQPHRYYEGKAYDTVKNTYSENFVSYAHDFDGDGWDDLLVLGFPGRESYWYQNPKGKEGAWPKHLAVKVTDNESPTFGDLTGDGKPEVIFHTGGVLGWAEPDASDPTKPFVFHPASGQPNSRFQKFTHGLGYGDVDGDGKADLLEARGWWQQPADLKGDPAWAAHGYPFGKGGAQMHAYDFDGDGDNDVITSHSAHEYGLSWFENQGKDDKGGIKFVQHWILSAKPGEKTQGVQFSQLHAVDLADINGDGLKDIVTGKRYHAHGPAGDPEPQAAPVLYWFELQRQDGKASFVPRLIDDNSGVGTQVMAVDLNGDKKMDVVVGNKRGQFLFLQE
jgi:hypothetical protein